MGQCMFRKKNIDNPPSYDEITESKINTAIDKDTINKLRAKKLKEIDEKYYNYLNKRIEGINKYIIDTAIQNEHRSIEYYLIFNSFKAELGIISNELCQEYYKRLINDMIEAYGQYSPVKKDNVIESEINLPDYKYNQTIVITLW